MFRFRLRLGKTNPRTCGSVHRLPTPWISTIIRCPPEWRNEKWLKACGVSLPEKKRTAVTTVTNQLLMRDTVTTVTNQLLLRDTRPVVCLIHEPGVAGVLFVVACSRRFMLLVTSC